MKALKITLKIILYSIIGLFIISAFFGGLPNVIGGTFNLINAFLYPNLPIVLIIIISLIISIMILNKYDKP